KRPLVEPELFASLRPVAYSGGIPGPDRTALGPRDEAEKVPGRGGEGKAADKPHATPPGAPGGKGEGYGRDLKRELDEKMDLGRGAVPVAQATKLGDYFQYVIDRPVTLPRQKSALLPIVGKEVEGTRVSIYNEKTQAKFPLLGLKLKNTS